MTQITKRRERRAPSTTPAPPSAAQLPLFLRVSATDWLGGDTDDNRPGWTVDDTVELASRLKGPGVDLVDVSTGGPAPDAKIPVGPGYQVPFAVRVRRRRRYPPLQSD